MRDSPGASPEVVEERAKPGGLLRASVSLALIVGFQAYIDEVFAHGGVPPKGASVVATAEESPNAERIREITSAFNSLGEAILPRLGKNRMSRKIMEVFALFREDLAALTGDERFGPPVFFGKPLKFHVDVRNKTQYLARLNGPYRIIQSSDEFDENDIGWLSFLMHEGAHVVHDNRHRTSGINWRDYLRFYESQSLAAVLTDEVDAYSRQIEMVNVCTGGRLKRSILEGAEPYIPTRDSRIRQFLELFAGEYYLRPATFKAFVRSYILDQDPNARFFDEQLREERRLGL